MSERSGERGPLGPGGIWTTIGRSLPRSPFGHQIITPTCREVQTDALAEAVERLRPAYEDVVSRYPDEARVHVLLVLTVPKDDESDREAHHA